MCRFDAALRLNWSGTPLKQAANNADDASLCAEDWPSKGLYWPMLMKINMFVGVRARSTADWVTDWVTVQRFANSEADALWFRQPFSCLARGSGCGSHMRT